MPKMKPGDQPEQPETFEVIPESEVLQEAIPLPERGTPLHEFLSDWVWAMPSTEVAQRLQDELALVGITSIDHLAQANVNAVRTALMAALRADAQALTGAAALHIKKE